MRRLLNGLADRFIDRLAAAVVEKAEARLLHPNTLLRMAAQREAADYAAAHMAGALAMGRRTDSLRVAYGRAPAEGLVLEFGVGGGDSTREIAALAAADGRTVHGFDSFTGLPEDWPGRHEEKGHYSLGGTPPDLPANVTVHAGLFQDTLPGFLAATTGVCAFVHLDADLYSSTKYVLDALAGAGRIGAGTVLLFDEYFNYPSWKDHEYRAFQEFVAANGVAYDYLLWGRQEVAVVVRDVGSGAGKSGA